MLHPLLVDRNLPILVYLCPKKRYAFTLYLALIAEERRWIPHDGYGMRQSPNFWRAVFVLVYGMQPGTHEKSRHPRGDDDPRWDELFKNGYPLFKELFGEGPGP